MTLLELAYKLRPYIEKAAQSLDDSSALEAPTLFPKWKEGESYAAGMRVRYNEVLYSVLMDHTSQADWTPVAAPSLFAKVLIPDENVIPEWEQPDSTNGYMAGDKVTYNDKVYVSLIDNNVWSPEAYPAGWQEVV
jgi:hypothetical protein